MCTAYRDRPIKSNTLLHTTEKSDSTDNNVKSEEQLSSYACSAEHRALRAHACQKRVTRQQDATSCNAAREEERDKDRSRDGQIAREREGERERGRAGEWENTSYHPP